MSYPRLNDGRLPSAFDVDERPPLTDSQPSSSHPPEPQSIPTEQVRPPLLRCQERAIGYVNVLEGMALDPSHGLALPPSGSRHSSSSCGRFSRSPRGSSGGSRTQLCQRWTCRPEGICRQVHSLQFSCQMVLAK